MEPTEILLLLLALPVVMWLCVTAGVAATTWLARRWGRDVPMDTFQERLFLPHPGQRSLPLTQRLHGLSVEGFWQTVAFGLQSVHMVRRFKSPPLDPDGGPPVILVAGYMENGGQMWLLARRLRGRGYQAVIFDLPSTLRSVGKNAETLGDEIDRVLAASGASRVALIGHSMGGVIMRTYVHGREAPPVAAVISLCSPHRGTRLARLGPGSSARDLAPGSPHLSRLPHSLLGQVPIHTLISTQDNIVSPAWSTVLCEGENVLLDEPVGHVAPLFLRSVEIRVSTWLEAADFAAPAPSSTVLRAS